MFLLNKGDRVTFDAKYAGTVRYIGKIKGKEGDWVGIELDTPNGKHNGTVDGISYFECNDNHGIFVKNEIIENSILRNKRNTTKKILKENENNQKETKDLTTFSFNLHNGDKQNESYVNKIELNNQISKNKQNAVINKMENSILKDKHGESKLNEMEFSKSIIKDKKNETNINKTEHNTINKDKTSVGNKVLRDVNERNKVWFLSNKIINLAIENDFEKLVPYKNELKKIMEKYNIHLN